MTFLYGIGSGYTPSPFGFNGIVKAIENKIIVETILK